MKILLTGSSGFIGFHLANKLLKLNHEVFGIDNHNDYYNVALKKERLSLLKHKNFYFTNSDISNLKLENKFDVAINLAAQAGVRVNKEQEQYFHKYNVLGFQNFCELCKKNGVKKIIYASSSSVYSDELSEPFNETSTPLKPKSLYGQSKLENEFFASKYSSSNKITMIGLRFFSVYGPFGRPDMAYYSFTNSIFNRKEIKLYNYGNMYRDMTYIDDIVDGIVGSLSYIGRIEQPGNTLVNLGNEHPVKTINLLRKIEKELDIEAKIKYETSLSESKFTHANITKARELLGYEPKFSLDEGLSRFIEWYKNYEFIH